MYPTPLDAQEIGFFDTTKKGDISSRISSDTTVLSDQISLNLNVLLRSIVSSIAVLYMMFRLNILLSLATFVSVPLVVVLSKYYGNIYRGLTKDAQKRLAKANGLSDEAFGSMTTVRAFAASEAESRLYASKLERYFQVNQRQALWYAAYAVAYTALPNLATCLVLFYGGKLVIEKSLSPGDLVSFMLYQQSLSAQFNTIGSIWTGIAGALGAAEKVFRLVLREPKRRKRSLCYRPPPAGGGGDGGGEQLPGGGPGPGGGALQGRLELRNVRLRYPARKDQVVLNGLTLVVEPGEKVALVGPSGGGKSSCLALLQGHYEPSAGQVLIDGRDIAEWDEQFLHSQMSIVSQEPTLYARSIRRNIQFGLEGTPGEPTMEAVVHAAKMANAHDFIQRFPDGYRTKCGEKGVALSGGQKQRIAIARALVRDPRVLLLDEATSALDAESEAVVQAALDAIMKDKQRTILVVAHRLSTVRDADRIVVIKEGRVVEQGNHDALVADPDSVYSALVKRQLKQ